MGRRTSKKPTPPPAADPAVEPAVALDPNDPAAQIAAGLRKNMKRVMDLFREWDENEDGEISKKEFKQAMKVLKIETTPDGVGAGGQRHPPCLATPPAPSARRVVPRAQAAPTHPRAPPQQRGRLPWPQELASDRTRGLSCVRLPRAGVDALFGRFDADGKGTIDFKELNKLVRAGTSVKLDPALQPGASGTIELSKTSPRSLASASPRTPTGA